MPLLIWPLNQPFFFSLIAEYVVTNCPIVTYILRFCFRWKFTGNCDKSGCIKFPRESFLFFSLSQDLAPIGTAKLHTTERKKTPILTEIYPHSGNLTEILFKFPNCIKYRHWDKYQCIWVIENKLKVWVILTKPKL